MLWWSNRRIIRYCYNHLECPPKIVGLIHSRNVCQNEVDYLQSTLGRVHTRRSLTHNKIREDGSKWISSSHDSKNIPQAMRNMKESILEEPLIHIVNTKNPSMISTWPTPPKDIYFTTLIWPPPLQRLKNIKKGLKTPKKSQNSSHRG